MSQSSGQPLSPDGQLVVEAIRDTGRYRVVNTTDGPVQVWAFQGPNDDAASIREDQRLHEWHAHAHALLAAHLDGL